MVTTMPDENSKAKKGEQTALDPKAKKEQLERLRDDFFQSNADLEDAQEEARETKRHIADILKDAKKVTFGNDGKGKTKQDIIKALRGT